MRWEISVTHPYCIGKILKMCQLALLNGTEPNIDNDWLPDKQDISIR